MPVSNEERVERDGCEATPHCISDRSRPGFACECLQVETIVVDSAWGGLGKPAHSTLLIHREDHHYLSDGKSISKERVTALLAAVGQPAFLLRTQRISAYPKSGYKSMRSKLGITQPTSTTRREQNSKRSFSSPLLLTNRRSNNDWTRFMAASIQTTIPTSR